MFRKAFAKLTNHKSLPPSDDQIRKHKDQSRRLEFWHKDVDGLTTILSQLKKEYDQHKGDFALGRYEELKDMIKSAIGQFHDVLKENSSRRYDVGTSVQGGKIDNLCQNAASFAKHQEELSSDEQRYAAMSAKDIDKDLSQFRKEILELKDNFWKKKHTLEKLEKEYLESKKLNPAQRYKTMKDMIKNALTDSSLL